MSALSPHDWAIANFIFLGFRFHSVSNIKRHTLFRFAANIGFLWSIPAVHLGQHLDRANLVAPMANAERLIPYREQLLRCPFHIGRDLLLDFFFRGLLQLVDNFPDTLAARTSPRIGGE